MALSQWSAQCRRRSNGLGRQGAWLLIGGKAYIVGWVAQFIGAGAPCSVRGIEHETDDASAAKMMNGAICRLRGGCVCLFADTF
jgi:hypothetical protein